MTAPHTDRDSARRPGGGAAVPVTGLAVGPATSQVTDQEAARRWRLVLGRYAAQELQQGQGDAGIERAL